MNIKDPVFQTYVIAASIMCLKMLFQAWVTVYFMIKVKGGYLHPEDIKKTGINPNPSTEQLKPNPLVERARSLQRNDTESLPAFWVAGFLFILTQPPLWLAQVLLYGYVVSRLLHAWALGTARIHDLRALEVRTVEAPISREELVRPCPGMRTDEETRPCRRNRERGRIPSRRAARRDRGGGDAAHRGRERTRRGSHRPARRVPRRRRP